MNRHASDSRAPSRTAALRISALNANGNQLHPQIGPEVDAVVHRAVELASLLDVPTVVLMSGLPAGAPGDTPNWITTSWPRKQTILDYQWNEVAIPYWKKLSAFGKERGVRFAVEMHGAQLVYNAETLLRLRDAVGENVDANLDPSHPMWMGADPRIVARTLSGAIHNVHAKDSPGAHRCRTRSPRHPATGGVCAAPVEFRDAGSWFPGGQQFWGQFLCELRSAGYDGVLSIEHEDVILDSVEGLEQTVSLLRAVLPVKPRAGSHRTSSEYWNRGL